MRAASSEDLSARLRDSYARILAGGVTTLEVKSGYGLTVAEELRALRLLESSYGVGVSVANGDGLTLPAGSIRDLNFATESGPK